MKNLLLLFIAAVAMVGTSNAFATPLAFGLKCDNGCNSIDGYACGAGFTDCLNDPNNCGSIGNVCSATGGTALCAQGECFVCTDETGCLGGGGGIGIIQTQKTIPHRRRIDAPFRLKPLNWKQLSQ